MVSICGCRKSLGRWRMNQRNIFDFETNQGIKRLEIQHGDIL